MPVSQVSLAQPSLTPVLEDESADNKLQQVNNEVCQQGAVG
jgi:hypothetical protein